MDRTDLLEPGGSRSRGRHARTVWEKLNIAWPSARSAWLRRPWSSVARMQWWSMWSIASRTSLTFPLSWVAGRATLDVIAQPLTSGADKVPARRKLVPRGNAHQDVHLCGSLVSLRIFPVRSASAHFVYWAECGLEGRRRVLRVMAVCVDRPHECNCGVYSGRVSCQSGRRYSKWHCSKGMDGLGCVD